MASAGPEVAEVTLQPAVTEELNTLRLLKVEDHYIQLLEKKIQRLEQEAAQASSSNGEEDWSVPPSPALEQDDEEDEDEEAEKDQDEKKPRKSQVRYLQCKTTAFGYDEQEVDDWDTTKSPEIEAEDAPTITWRRTQSASNSSPPKQELVIESKVLENALSEVLAKTGEMAFNASEVAFLAPYAILYHSEDKLRKYAENEANAAAKPEIDILLTSLHKEQRALRKEITAYKNKRIITHELLWALFYPGCRVVQRIMGEMQQFVVSHILNFGRDDDRWNMFVAGIDYDGEEFLPVGRMVSIKPFSGNKEITELPVYPTEFWRDPKNDDSDSTVLAERLEIRGKIFEDLCLAKLDRRHRQYRGLAITAGSIEMAKDDDTDDRTVYTDTDIDEKSGQEIALDDFVMIDHYAYLNLSKIGPTENLKIGKEEVEWLDTYATVWQERWRHFIGDLPILDDGKLHGTLTREQLQFCPPRVLGFAISQKKFVQLLVVNVRKNVSQRDKEKPWNDLKLRKADKDTLKSLVVEHANSEVIEDIIPGKGKGLVVLLHGPPGVGKTLSAESLAILTDKPLYSVSMADIGISPRTVEGNLRRIFELATHWKAILLFDEADVFLEARSLEDVRRNSLVSTLLRILEYFQGILFLTSNRAKTFDEAFTSRIHMAIKFVPLTDKQQAEIWRLWFNRAKDAIDPSFNLEEALDYEDGTGTLTKHNLNGREIRNIVRSAMSLAMSDTDRPRKLMWKHVERVLGSTLAFKNYMLQGEEMAKRDNIR